MKEIYIALAILAGIIILILLLSLYNRYKLRNLVRYQWGRQPHQTRLDKEESLKNAWQTEKKFRKFESEVDDITWYDLDLFAIFDLVNATYSSVGSEALYQRMRSFNLGDSTKTEKLIQIFQDNPSLREEVQFQFARLGKQDKNFTKEYLAQGVQKELGNFWQFALLGALPFVGLLLLLLGQGIGIILLIGTVLFNVIYYLMKKTQLETELNSMRYLVQTIALAEKIAKLNLPDQAAIKQNLKPLKGIAFWGFSFRTKGFSETEMIMEYLNMVFMIPFLAYHFVLKKLSNHTKEAINLWELLGNQEVAIAILNFRTFMPLTCIPTFKAGNVTATDIYHPLVNGAIVNPVNWQKNTLVTGSNASGKSTYVKSIAISCVLSQTINTALAKDFTLQAGHVITSMAIEDDIFEGDSYFVAETKSIKRLLDLVAQKERCYCFVDEILKGTNTVERIAASASVVKWLADYPSLAFVATHDIELTEILKNHCDNLHFGEEVTDDEGVTFDYKVKKGPATSRNAIALLKVLHYPASLVKNAQNEASYFDENRSWQVLD
ncbi:DNA mismatch repair protein MutS [Enterococcus asini]|uniref:MutS-related protein n=1 Tax=Enterococcus asini TaxID=57732 RepID=UPI0028925BE1|nr:DNA mismatch repair protein MutS [Enterococcus asini]MDT2756047.1 DNA mismatch repair protein MutS [Enterococcus asini]